MPHPAINQTGFNQMGYRPVFPYEEAAAVTVTAVAADSQAFERGR
jgi:hypothetical protein